MHLAKPASGPEEKNQAYILREGKLGRLSGYLLKDGNSDGTSQDAAMDGINP